MLKRPVHRVRQELVFFSVRDHELAYRVETLLLPNHIAPDAHIRQHLLWEGDDAPLGAMLHSTSWRYDHDTIALTWAITPDLRRDLPVSAVRPAPIAQGTDGANPVPADLNFQQVVNHAARHLAFLAHTDPIVDEALHLQPELHDALLAFAPDVSGNPHR